MTTEEKILLLSETNKETLSKAKELFPEYFIKYDKDKIYAFKGCTYIYKLHRVGSRFAWVSICESSCYADGDYESPNDALKNRKYQEFKNIEDFIYWLNEQI